MVEAGKDADLVAVDFYSRYQRPTAPSCERFAAAPGAPACKTNRLRWCHTDLGANVVNYQRFLAEGRRFGGLGVRGQEAAGSCRGICTPGRGAGGGAAAGGGIAAIAGQARADACPSLPLLLFAWPAWMDAGCVWWAGCGAL